MAVSEWIETTALLIIFFLLVGIFRLLWALVSSSQRQSLALRHHDDALSRQAQDIADNEEASQVHVRTVLGRLDAQDADLSLLREALVQISQLLTTLGDTATADPADTTQTPEQENNPDHEPGQVRSDPPKPRRKR